MLVSGRVRLRSLERSDLPSIVRWFNDPATRALLARSTPMSLAEEERWFEGLLKSTTDAVFAIEELTTSTPRLIGSCGLHRIDWRNRNGVLGIVIGEVSDRGQGFGADAMTALVRHCIADLGLYRVELEVIASNERAQRTYERVGFVVEGVRRGAIFKDGRFTDLVLMSMLASQVLPLPEGVAPAVASKRKRG
jgi:RimJ/RimL family protein N-acetyltransferase